MVEFDKQLIRERTVDGLKNARRQCVVLGRPSVTTRPGFAQDWAIAQADPTSSTSPGGTRSSGPPLSDGEDFSDIPEERIGTDIDRVEVLENGVCWTAIVGDDRGVETAQSAWKQLEAVPLGRNPLRRGGGPAQAEPAEEVPCRDCGGDRDMDGYDGRCGNCANRAGDSDQEASREQVEAAHD